MTEESETNNGEGIMEAELLTDAPVPELYEEQLSGFNVETIHAQKIMDFDPADAIDVLSKNEGKRILSADFGGDKGKIGLFEVSGGKLSLVEGYSDYIQGDDGIGYLETIKKASRFAEDNNIPFGISWGGPLDGNKMVFHPKATALFKELGEQFDGDFSKISPSIKVVLNDGPAGIVAGAVHASKEFSATDIVFLINGGGLGVGALKDGEIFATEGGHIEGVKALNTYDQSTPCGVFGSSYTCLELLGSNKKGIEAQWEGITGSDLSAKEIEDEYRAGNRLAGELYDHSATVIAHTIQGVANVFGINLQDQKSAIVCDGAAFRFPNYGDRVSQILGAYGEKLPQTLLTKDRVSPDSNVFMEGAAIAALMAQ